MRRLSQRDKMESLTKVRLITHYSDEHLEDDSGLVGLGYPEYKECPQCHHRLGCNLVPFPLNTTSWYCRDCNREITFQRDNIVYCKNNNIKPDGYNNGGHYCEQCGDKIRSEWLHRTAL